MPPLVTLVDCSHCRTPLLLPTGADCLRCYLCNAVTRIAPPSPVPPANGFTSISSMASAIPPGNDFTGFSSMASAIPPSNDFTGFSSIAPTGNDFGNGFTSFSSMANALPPGNGFTSFSPMDSALPPGNDHTSYYHPLNSPHEDNAGNQPCARPPTATLGNTQHQDNTGKQPSATPPPAPGNSLNRSYEDKPGNYDKAFSLFSNALGYFETHLKNEKDPKIKKAITEKFTQYLRRAERIHPGLGSGTNKDGGGGDEEQAKLRSNLDSAIIREKPNVSWSDVAGLDSAKQALQEAVILPVKFPQFFTGKRRPWRAFLLYGPPGTGKSYLAKAVATEADSTFFSISSSDLLSKWLGESERLVANLFQMARDSAPSIIFIDEIDSLCGQRGEDSQNEHTRGVKTEILVQMQGVSNNDQKVLILAATNTPYTLDQAIRRRFDKRIYIPLPDWKARKYMFKVHLGDTPNNLTESDFEDLASRSEGFSGSDISVCVKDVLFEPVRQTQAAMYFKKVVTEEGEQMWMPCGPGEPGYAQITMHDLASKGFADKILPPPIKSMDFHKVLSRQKPTVNNDDLKLHEKFTQEFGEEG